MRDFPYKEEYEGIHRQRQIDVAIQLFEAMGIERHDKEKRMDWMLRGFRQFDAPVSLVLTYDKYLEPAAISQFALGSLAYGIVLAAWERGLGCVINGQGIMQSDVVREHAEIPDDESIMICIAMGYPDDSFPPMMCALSVQTMLTLCATSGFEDGQRIELRFANS